MSEIAKTLVNRIGDTVAAAKQFSALVAQVKDQTGQSDKDARLDVAARIAEFRRKNPPPLTAYERILSDVANGRPRPKDFDASGP